MRGDTYWVQGVQVRVEADDGPALRGATRLLGGFPQVAAPREEAVAGAETPQVRLTLRFTPRPAAPPESARPLFRHRDVRGLRDGARLWLTDGWSCLVIDTAAGCAEGEIHPGSWARAREFEEGFLLLGLLELLRGRGRFHLHAAALVAGEVGILAAGDSGSGKSTLTYAWAREGGLFMGDDAILLRVEAQGVRAAAWPEPVRLDPALAAYFPELAGGDRSESGKLAVMRDLSPNPSPARGGEFLYAGSSAPEQATPPSLQGKGGAPPRSGGPGLGPAECRPGVLLLPVVAAGPTRLEPLARREALAALIPASALLLADPALAPAHLEALRALVLQCRCYRLFQGPDLLRRPQAVGDLLWALACPQEWGVRRP